MYKIYLKVKLKVVNNLKNFKFTKKFLKKI